MNLYITKLNAIGNIMQAIQHMTAEIAHQLAFRERGIYYYNTGGKPLYAGGDGGPIQSGGGIARSLL